MRFTIYLFIITVLTLLHPASAAEKVIAPQAESVAPLLNGMSIPNVTLRYADGSPVSLTALAMQKPTVLMFYRGGWCPYCNRQFGEMQTIEEELVSLGYQIVAISPQTVEALSRQQLKTEMQVEQLSDASLEAITQFGLGFHVDNMTALKYAANNIPLTEDTAGKPVLPAPAVFIVDQKGIIQFSYVNPDFKVRPSAALILAVAKVLAEQ